MLGVMLFINASSIKDNMSCNNCIKTPGTRLIQKKRLMKKTSGANLEYRNNLFSLWYGLVFFIGNFLYFIYVFLKLC